MNDKLVKLNKGRWNILMVFILMLWIFLFNVGI